MTRASKAPFLHRSRLSVYKRFTILCRKKTALALTVGAGIGPFLVKSSLGEGGMGVSFACSSGSEYLGVQAIKITAIRIGSLKIVDN